MAGAATHIWHDYFRCPYPNSARAHMKHAIRQCVPGCSSKAQIRQLQPAAGYFFSGTSLSTKIIVSKVRFSDLL